MLRIALAIALTARLLGGLAWASGLPTPAGPTPAGYKDLALLCEFQRQVVFHAPEEWTTARSMRDVPQPDLCGHVVSDLCPFVSKKRAKSKGN